jgi:hypothetical protein
VVALSVEQDGKMTLDKTLWYSNNNVDSGSGSSSSSSSSSFSVSDGFSTGTCRPFSEMHQAETYTDFVEYISINFPNNVTEILLRR